MIILNDGTPHEIGKDFVPNIETIAHALAYINRYTGHVGQYSVAQHCVLIAMQLPQELKLAGLLHDAPEAYLGDVSAPLKRHLPDYKKLEFFYHQVIDKHFGVETEHQTIKEYDLRMLIAEFAHFGLPLEYVPDVAPLYNEIEVWSPECAKEAFLAMYENLIIGESNPINGDKAVPYNLRYNLDIDRAKRFRNPDTSSKCLCANSDISKDRFKTVILSTPNSRDSWLEDSLNNVDRAQLQALGESLSGNYYCQCDNDHCGSWFQLGKEGDTCKECKVGKLYPQDVEPFGDE